MKEASKTVQNRHVCISCAAVDLVGFNFTALNLQHRHEHTTSHNV